MDGFELNKIAGAVLATLLVYIGIKNLGDVLFRKCNLPMSRPMSLRA